MHCPRSRQGLKAGTCADAGDGFAGQIEPVNELGKIRRRTVKTRIINRRADRQLKSCDVDEPGVSAFQ